MYKKILTLAMSCFFLNAHALTIDENHPIKTSIAIRGTHLSQTATKQVTLMNIKLTPKEKRHFTHSVPKKILMTNDLPKKAEVGMNGVPVLDQGRHGSCVTFATTAAVDAVLGKGDYISQLCNLELGRYLKQRADFYPSGWNGSWGPIVLNQMIYFGIVSKATQVSKSCAGVSEYPVDDEEDNGNPLSLDEFKKLKESLVDQNIGIKEILNVKTRLGNPDPILDAYDGNKLLRQVKEYLASHTGDHSMLTFGTFLTYGNCGNIACGKYHVNGDAWVINDYSKDHPDEILGGHEMIITGYDDDAVALDNNGKEHKGLLTLRNSWGTEAGDQGNYYMSYDYFMQTVIEVNKIYIETDQ